MGTVSRPVSSVLLRDFPVGPETAVPKLQQDEIHVWRTRLEDEPEKVEKFRRILSPDELERAERFRFDKNRNEYVVSRGILRNLLASYLGALPQELNFVYSQYGRPSLAGVKLAAMLNFNVAHSAQMALFAFAHGRRLGVDVEQVRHDFSTGEIADRFFSLSERAALRHLPQEERHEAFFRCWTRKEAFIKALGEGLSHPLDQFDVSLRPDESAALLATRPDASEARSWGMWDVQVPNGYAAALAAESHRGTR